MASWVDASYRLIVIGLSTGGPRCIQQLFGAIHLRDVDRVVILQHMPIAMTEGYAKRLSQAVRVPVKIAETGDVIAKHSVLLCPGIHHLSFARAQNGSLYVRVTGRKMDYLYAPSIDLAFASLARLNQPNVLAVVLTGMGNDGTAGAQKLKDAGALVLAQHPEEAAAPGMPSSIIEAGLADHIFRIDEMASFLSDPSVDFKKRAL